MGGGHVVVEEPDVVDIRESGIQRRQSVAAYLSFSSSDSDIPEKDS
jgi:hypothetical protein